MLSYSDLIFKENQLRELFKNRGDFQNYLQSKGDTTFMTENHETPIMTWLAERIDFDLKCGNYSFSIDDPRGTWLHLPEWACKIQDIYFNEGHYILPASQLLKKFEEILK